MKRAERHHLKENALVAWLVDAQGWIQQHQGAFSAGIISLAIVVTAGGGFTWWRARVAQEAATLLASAVAIAEAPIVSPPADPELASPPEPGSYPSAVARLEAALPELIAVADRYPRTPAGLAARYQAAAGLTNLGRYEEAEEQYGRVIEDDPGGLTGRMAELGLAETAIRAGQPERAIELFEEVSSRQESDIPLEVILLQLGHAYAAAGRAEEAQESFTRIVDEFPQSLYVADARRELEKLTSTGG